MKNISSTALQGLANSYAQLFLSTNPLMGLLVGIASFTDPWAGLCGLLMALFTNTLAIVLQFNQARIASGYYAFNALLTGLFLGASYEWNAYLLLILFFASLLCLLLTVILGSWLSFKSLPFLSLPFLLAVWMLKLALDGFVNVSPNSGQIFIYNNLMRLGGFNLLHTYEFFEHLQWPLVIKSYFKSLGAILFQYNMLAGLLIAIGLLIHSRIAFILSVIGFGCGYVFYVLVGANLNDLNYGFIGFNFILSAMAIGGFFLIPNLYSHLLVLVLTPVIAILGIASQKLLGIPQLPLLSLPFNIMVMMVLYFLYFRDKAEKLILTPFQFFSPEKNLYRYLNQHQRFGKDYPAHIQLPVMGNWHISQAHAGNITHKGEWQYAWDFDLQDDEKRTYRMPGMSVDQYYCYNLPVIAPAAGEVVKVVDHIPDNGIHEVNLDQNWGNSIVIKHAPYLYSKLSHLKAGSIRVKEGDFLVKGQTIATIGNSGRSPEPHLHFQLQATPYIGSKTLFYPVSRFIGLEPDKYVLNRQGIPQEDDWVCNLTPTPLLSEAFHLIPGKKIRWEVTKTDNKHYVEWEVMTNELNQTYLYCHQSASLIYFTNDNLIYESLSFFGKKDSLLFSFFLATQNVSLGYYQDLTIESHLEIVSLFHPLERLVQDVFASFSIFLHADCLLKYVQFENDLTDSNITLNATILTRRFGMTRKNREVSMLFNKNKLTKLVVGNNQIDLTAVCISEF